jgi:hypothetical protein
MVDHANKAADKYPDRFIVMDTSTHKILGTGKDLGKLWTRVEKKLTKGQLPLIYKRARENGSLTY